MQTEEGFAPVFFDPRPLTNLVLIDELESLSPVLDMQACLLLSSSMASHMLLQAVKPACLSLDLHHTQQGVLTVHA